MKKYMAFIFLVTFTACQEDDNTLLQTQTAVIEAFLFEGQTVNNIKITQSNSYSDSDSLTVTLDNLLVSLSDGKNDYLLNSTGDGLYELPSLTIQVETNYFLQFEHYSELITAQTFVPKRKNAASSTSEITMNKIEAGTFPNFGNLPDPIEIEWDNSEGDYYYVVVQNIEEEPEVINELFESEEFQNRGFRFISEPQIMDFYSINPMRELQQFGQHLIIVFRVNPEYASLYETAGSTSTTISEPPTNINNGLGIFTGVSSDTLFLNVKKG